MRYAAPQRSEKPQAGFPRCSGAFLSPLESSRQERPNNDAMPCWARQPWPHNLKQMVSGKAGAAQSAGRDLRRPEMTVA